MVLETALDQEMTEHLGHGRNGQVVNEAGNVRNGTQPKTVLTEAAGEVGIEVPRDRNGTFEPQVVKKRQRRLTGVDDIGDCKYNGSVAVPVVTLRALTRAGCGGGGARSRRARTCPV
jgi:hypothetical protein